MAAVEFAVDITLDGYSYPASRGAQGERQVVVNYQPKVKSERTNAVGDATLDPVEYTSFHRGGGASRNLGVPGMVAYGENIWTCDPGILMPGPEVTGFTLTGATAPVRPDGVAEADGHIFAAAGRYIFRLTNGQVQTPVPSQDLDYTAGQLAYSLRRFGSSIVASSTGFIAERPDGGAWTTVPIAGPVQPTGALGRVWWTTGNVTSERLAAQFGTRGIRYAAGNPRLDSSWTPGLGGPAIDIGGEGRITRFTHTMTHLYIAATAGLHDLDSSGLAPNLVPEAESMPMPTGGLAALSADGYVYYSAAYDLFRVQATGTQYGQVQTITPLIRVPNETPIGGYGTDLVKHGEWLIYSLYDHVNDVSWVLWGREAGQGEIGPIVWNVAPIVLRGWKVTSLHISGLATDGPRLYMFGHTLAGAVSGRWAPLSFTTPYADLKHGRARRFSQTAYVLLPAEDAGDDSIPKDIEEVLNENENVAAGNTIKVSARREDDVGFTQLAAFTSGPRINAAVKQAFVTLRPTFRIEFVGTPTSPPISRRVSIRWLPNPDRREVRRYILQVGRAEQFAAGNRSGVGAEDAISRLASLATSAARVNLTDEFGQELTVRVLKLEGPAEVQAVTSNEYVLACSVTLSVFGGQPLPTFTWDSGAEYLGHSWS